MPDRFPPESCRALSQQPTAKSIVHERTSTSILQNGRVKAVELDAGICGGEAPVHLLWCARSLPRHDSHPQFRQAADALVEALYRQGGEEDFGDVEPTAVLGRVMNLESLGNAAGLGRLECLVEAG